MALTAEQTEKLLRDAIALEEAGKHREAARLLLSRLRNITAHGQDPMPCLCKRCLVPEQAIAERNGVRYLREYAVSDGRLLFFWLPADLLKRRGEVRRAVEDALGAKTRRRAAS